jgi:hypothetical protein
VEEDEPVAKRRQRGKTGTALAALQSLIRDSGEIRARVQVRLPRRKDPVDVWMYVGRQSAAVSAQGRATRALPLPVQFDGGRDASMLMLRDLAARLMPGRAEPGSCVASGAECEVDDATLARKVEAAWCEALGNEVPSDDELRASQDRRQREVERLFARFVEDVRRRPAEPTAV